MTLADAPEAGGKGSCPLGSGSGILETESRCAKIRMGPILDTFILIAAERGAFALPAFLAAWQEKMCCLAVITASELIYGMKVADTPRRREVRRSFAEAVLAAVPLIVFDAAIARTHARIWAGLDRAGARIGAATS